MTTHYDRETLIDYLHGALHEDAAAKVIIPAANSCK